VPQIEMCKQSLTKTQGTKMKGKPTTIGMEDLRLICYTTRSMPFKWQTDHFIQTASCKVVPWNKFWKKEICRWFCSHFLYIFLQHSKIFKPNLGDL